LTSFGNKSDHLDCHQLVTDLTLVDSQHQWTVQ